MHVDMEMSQWTYITIMFILKMKDEKIKQVLLGGEYQWEEGGHKKKVKEGEYGR
jgi:hypothetical protein